MHVDVLNKARESCLTQNSRVLALTAFIGTLSVSYGGGTENNKLKTGSQWTCCSLAVFSYGVTVSIGTGNGAANQMERATRKDRFLGKRLEWTSEAIKWLYVMEGALGWEMKRAPSAHWNSGERKNMSKLKCLNVVMKQGSNTREPQYPPPHTHTHNDTPPFSQWEQLKPQNNRKSNADV